MIYILLWASLNPVFLGEYSSEAACRSAALQYAQTAAPGFAQNVASIGRVIAIAPQDMSPEAIASNMVCVPKAIK